MTCKDCIHYNVVTYPKGTTLPDNDIALTRGICTFSQIWVEPTSVACNIFCYDEGSCEDPWESVSK